MSELFRPESLVALLTLTSLEIVLGIDNVVFIAIISGKLPHDQRQRARLTGLALAALGRVLLLLCVAWIITLDKTPLFPLLGREISVKDLILIAGGLFLLAKATWEIHHNLEGPYGKKADDTHDGGKHGKPGKSVKAIPNFSNVILQILLLDLVFSIDSVLTAVGMVDPSRYESPPFPGTGIPWVPLAIMITSVVLAIAVMLIFAGPLSRFIENHPTMKMLALSFLLLIGMVLVAEGLHQHIPRGYIYFAMGFSLFVELLNLKLVKRGPKRATIETVARSFDESEK